MTSICLDESTSSSSKQGIQPLIRLCCMLSLHILPCSHICTRYANHMAQQKHLLRREEWGILNRQERYCTRVHFIHFLHFPVIYNHANGNGLCMDNGGTHLACHISNPTHPQWRQRASKRPQPSCWEWVAALTLLSVLSKSLRACWSVHWGKGLSLQLAVSIRLDNRIGA